MKIEKKTTAKYGTYEVKLKGDMIYIYNEDILMKAIQAQPSSTFEKFDAICKMVEAKVYPQKAE